jgi:hypothetical protein
MKALQKDPAQRFASASEFALALSECTLAGKWTHGDATYVAKHSSRPPPPEGVPALLGVRSPRAEPKVERTGFTPPELRRAAR